jgi:hypothetical protein
MFGSVIPIKILISILADTSWVKQVLDKWEEMMQKMKQLSVEERMKRIDMIKSMCTCRGCPSYVGTGEAEVQFCGTGKSSKITEERGCICGTCPVVEHMGLTKIYYCTQGSEAEQRGVSM